MPAAVALLAGAFLLAADDVAAEEAARRAADLREEIRALETLRRVRPSAEQAEWMLHAAGLLARERSATEARRDAILAEQREAFRRFLEEDHLDRGFTPEVEREAADASHRMKELQEGWERSVARLTAVVREILSPGQEDAVEGRKERRGVDPNRPPATAEEVMSLLLRARALPEQDFRRREGQIAGFALRSPGIHPGTTRDQVVEALRRFRDAPEGELPRLRDDLVDSLFPGVRARELQKQVAELKRVGDEPPGRLGQFLASRSAVPALEALLKDRDHLPPLVEGLPR